MSGNLRFVRNTMVSVSQVYLCLMRLWPVNLRQGEHPWIIAPPAPGTLLQKEFQNGYSDKFFHC
jgi:hypothetical protein